MSIPDKDTLRLFSYSAGLCNFCKETLIEDVLENISNLGERAHIHGKRKGSARYIDQNSNDDSYHNLILLCLKHHKLVDDHPKKYPVSLLHAIKSDHEMRIRQNPLIQSHGDVAIIKGIFSVYDLMYLNNIIKNQSLNCITTDIIDILDLENDLLKNYKDDYPFRHPLLQEKTAQMFYFLRKLNTIFHDYDVFIVEDIKGNPHLKIISNSRYSLKIQDAWKYFNLFRTSFSDWYRYCKSNYGI